MRKGVKNGNLKNVHFVRLKPEGMSAGGKANDN